MQFKMRNGDGRYNFTSRPEGLNFNSEPMEKWLKPATKYTCTCCNTNRTKYAFMEIPDATWGYLDDKGVPRAIFCVTCLDAIFKQFNVDDPDHNAYKSLYRICMMTNMYYSDILAHKIMEETHTFKNGEYKDQEIPMEVSRVDLYNRAIMDDPVLSKKTFWQSDNFVFEDVLKYQREVGALSEQDKKNRRLIIEKYHYDPFEGDSLEDRSRQMEDLITMTDESMADDLVRQRAAIEIVKTFNRIDKLGKAISDLQKDTNETASHARQIKELIETKKKETDMVTAFSKDHGFAEKYATAKSKGSGTLSAIVRDINEKGYDQGAVNKFDIDTANAMKQVSDISAESIFKQISFSESEYASMVQEQNEIIRKMRSIMQEQAEELRLLREKHLKQELLEEYRNDLRNKEIDPAEIDGLVQQQMEIPVNYDYKKPRRKQEGDK